MKMNDITSEAEGTPEGVPHLSKELITHIIQQVGTEGAQAIVKSLQWGDGAAKELLQLIVKDLKQDISMAESVKQRLDPKCWKGKHKEGTKIKGGVRVNNCVPNESVAEGVDHSFDMRLAKILKQRGYSGPVKLEQLGMKWIEAIGDIVDIDDYIMVQGNDPDYDGWVSYVYGFGKYAFGAEQGYTTGTAKRVEIETRDDQGVAEEWSQKYKSSINCSNPKGFSQKAHCAGKSNNEDTVIAEGEKKTMSRAAKGNEKYGKDGMKALAKAGREGASEKKLDAIRDEHDNYNESVDELSRVLELSGLNLSADEQFDIIEEMVEQMALKHGVDPEEIWEDFESVDDMELLDESAAWHRKAGKSASGGLNDKGIASYRREHPGSHLQKAVTTKPSKLKKGSKAAKRRKSFCARMSGVKGPMKKPNGKPTRKALALRKWNCE